jgi:hypothetical protein
VSGGRPFEAGDIAAIVTNPIYAFRIHPSLGRAHEHSLSETEWIAANERAIAELGSSGWLELFVDALGKDHSRQDPSEHLPIADPYPAITVHRELCEEYPPIVPRETWLGANVRGVDEDAAAWLRNLVSVLKGAYA